MQRFSLSITLNNFECSYNARTKGTEAFLKAENSSVAVFNVIIKIIMKKNFIENVIQS